MKSPGCPGPWAAEFTVICSKSLVTEHSCRRCVRPAAEALEKLFLFPKLRSATSPRLWRNLKRRRSDASQPKHA